jgi:hypothetical protein
MIEYLEQLLPGPFCATLGAQIVEDEYRSIPHVIKTLIVRDRTLGTERGAQVIEQIRDDYKQGSTAARYLLVGNSNGQMRLTAAISTQEYQPTLWILRETPACFENALQVGAFLFGQSYPFRLEGLECKTPHGVQVTESPKVFQVVMLQPGLLANARDDLTEVWVPYRQVFSQIAGPAADRAGFGLSVYLWL